MCGLYGYQNAWYNDKKGVVTLSDNERGSLRSACGLKNEWATLLRWTSRQEVATDRCQNTDFIHEGVKNAWCKICIWKCKDAFVWPIKKKFPKSYGSKITPNNQTYAPRPHTMRTFTEALITENNNTNCTYSNNTNSRLDATITNCIDNYNQLNMFRAIISPILRSTDCVYSLWYNAPTMLPAGSIVGALYHKL